MIPFRYIKIFILSNYKYGLVFHGDFDKFKEQRCLKIFKLNNIYGRRCWRHEIHLCIGQLIME